MIIVGERLNSSRPGVLRSFKEKNEDWIIKEALLQEKAGASFIDLNASLLLENEIETLKWAIPLLQENINVPLVIDTPNSEAMKIGLSIHKGQAILNSLTAEKEKCSSLIPIIEEFSPKVIALCFNEEGLPPTPQKALSIASGLIDMLDKISFSMEDLFLDPLVRPVGVDPYAGKLFLDSLKLLKKKFPEIKTIAGISNVSFGFPSRSLLNRIFLVLALQRGLDAAICDPLDKEIQASLKAAEALLGKDKGMSGFIGFLKEQGKKKSI